MSPTTINPADHLGLVIRVVNRYIRLGIPESERDDMIGEGNLALCRAAAKVGNIRNRFSTYATPAIENAIAAYVGRLVLSPEIPMGDMSDVDDYEARRLLCAD